MNLPDFDVVLENKPLASKIMSHKRSIQYAHDNKNETDTSNMITAAHSAANQAANRFYTSNESIATVESSRFRDNGEKSVVSENTGSKGNARPNECEINIELRRVTFNIAKKFYRFEMIYVCYRFKIIKKYLSSWIWQYIYKFI